MKKLFAILMSIMLIACFMPTMAFADTPTASVDGAPVSITGKIGEAFSADKKVTINLINTEGEDVKFAEASSLTNNGWITGIPENSNIEYTVKRNSDTQVEIAFTGTPSKVVTETKLNI